MTGGGAPSGTAAPDTDATAWEAPRRAAPQDTAPILSVDGFEGPLDWLVEMARARKVDLSKLSILALVEAFGAAMDAATAQCRARGSTLDLSRWGAWLVMAAHLTELRSRLLLPADAPAARAAQAEAAALQGALASRAAAAAAADWLEHRPQLGREVFARGQPAGRGIGGAGIRDITALLRACLVALRLPEGADSYQPARPPFWTPGDAVGHITRALDLMPGGAALEGFLPRVRAEAADRELLCRGAVASTLVAALELARDGTALLAQDEPWHPIHVSGPERRSDRTGTG